MTRIILIISFISFSLFAVDYSSAAFVYRVHSLAHVDETYFWFDDYLDGEYSIQSIKEAVPERKKTTIPYDYYSSDYIALMPVMYNKTLYPHGNVISGQYSIYIDVYFPATIPSNSSVFIWERNQYERAKNLNDRLIQGYANVQTYGQIDYTDGSKLVRYLVPDMSSYHKRITIATCPNNKLQTEVVCTYTAIDIYGSTNYAE